MTSKLLRTLCLVSLAAPAAAEGVFQDVSVYDALALARRAKRVVLVAWTRADDPQCKRMENVWADPGVTEWIRQHAVAVQIDGEKEPRQASNWNVTRYPTTLLLKPNGAAILRTSGFTSPEEFVVEADAAVEAERSGESEALVEPMGEEAESPEAWLAYANSLYAKGGTDPSACIDAYLWCLDNGEVHSPGFSDTYLDLILKRLISMDQIASTRDDLRVRRDQYARGVAQGFVTPASLRTILRINEFLKEPRQSVVVYEMITQQEEPDPVLLDIVVDGVLETFVGHKRYEEALAHAGDVLARARAEGAKLDQTMDGKTPGAGAADTMEAKREFVDRFGRYYEALLGVGRGADAAALAEIVLDTVPTGNACGILIGHAKRLDLDKVAENLAAAGTERVRSEKGKKLIERALLAKKLGFRRQNPDETRKTVDGARGEKKEGKDDK